MRKDSPKNWEWLAIFAVVVALAFALRSQGRLWFCECERILLWTSNAWSADTSQHFLDPYSFTHLLHGFLFFWLIKVFFSKISIQRGLLIAVVAESVWELIENSSFVIERYREATAALGYYGDTIFNSLGDVASCGIGFLVARSLGVARSMIVFLLIETILLFWIRDSLLLNILMLIYPLDSIKNWQTNH